MITWAQCCKNSPDFAGFTSYLFKLQNPVEGYFAKSYFRFSDFDSFIYSRVPPRLYVSSNRVTLCPAYRRRKTEVFSVPRGRILFFSAASRARFEQKLEGFSHLGWCDFVTLTFRTRDDGVRVGCAENESEFQDMRYCYSLLKAWVRSVDAKLLKRWGRLPLWAWKKEFQSNGTVHFHLMCTLKLRFRYKGRSFVRYLEKTWARLTGNYSENSVDLSKIRKCKSAAWYMSKYISKTDKKENPYCTDAPFHLLLHCFVGRWWGFFNLRFYKACFRKPRVHFLSSSLFRSIYGLLSNFKGFQVDWRNVRPISFSRSATWGLCAWRKCKELIFKFLVGVHGLSDFMPPPPSERLIKFSSSFVPALSYYLPRRFRVLGDL